MPLPSPSALPYATSRRLALRIASAGLARQVLPGSLVLAATAAAMAQPRATWPTKPVTVVVSFPPGGDSDAVTRIVVEQLTPRLGVPVVVEHRSGASGTLGNASVARAAPDGHTLLCAPNTVVTAPLVIRPGSGASYDPQEDLEPVTLVGEQPLFAVVHADTGVHDIAQLLAAARRGAITSYATPGSGTPMHILGALFNRSAGLALTQVPYRGSAPAVADLVGGHVPLMFTSLGPVLQHLQSGRLRNLAVAEPRRSPMAPEVPTLAEAGVAGAEVGAWHAFFAPRGTPAPIVQRLHTLIHEVLQLPEVRARLLKLALLPVGGDPAALRRRVAADHARDAQAIRTLGLQAD